MLFAYIVIRSITVPITYDEAATFFHYVHVGKVWPGQAHWDANNHVLNSVLTLLSYKVFGNAEWALRLPNLLAGLLYLFYAFKISFRAESRSLRWALFLSLTLSRFVIEFFSLSRGYGLSMGLFMMALYHVYEWSLNHRSIQLVLAMIAMQLAVFANLSLLTTDLLFCCWIFLLLLLDKKSRKRISVAALIAALPAIGWFVHYGFELKERGLLYYGEGDSFWSVTVRTITDYGLGPYGHIARPLLIILLPCLFVLAILWLRKRTANDFRRLIFAFLLLGSISAALVMHWLLNVNYPMDRVAIHFLILFPLTVIFLIEDVWNSVPKRRWLQLMAVPLVIYPISFLSSANVTYSVLWNRDASARKFYDQLVEIDAASEAEPIVTGYRMRLIPYCYYNLRNNGDLSPMQAEGYRSNEADYQIAYLGVEADWSDYDTLVHDVPSDLYLMRRKSPLLRNTIFQKDITALEQPSDQDFFEWFNSNIDSLIGQDLLVEVEVEMPAINQPLPGWLSVSVADSVGESVFQENIIIDWLRSEWKPGDKFHYQIMVPNVPEKAKTMKVFFWNIEKHPLAFGDVELKIQLLEENR